MNGFTKLFSSIVTSTIWQEDPETKVVWVTMLALVNAEGFVDTTIPGLANIANISVEKTREAIAKFEGPDPDSRTEDHDGRRIAKVDNGWFLLNHAKYRKIRDPEERKRYMRDYMKEYRKQNVKKVNNVNSGKPQLAHTEADTEAEAEAKKEKTTIKFDYNSFELTGITNKDTGDWSEAFPAVDIRQEIKSARQWLIDNPTKRKKQIRRFLTNWLRRQQERGGNRSSQSNTSNNAGKTKLFPLPGKTCSTPKCIIPAVYKSTGGAYDFYYCGTHMPESVKKEYYT